MTRKVWPQLGMGIAAAVMLVCGGAQAQSSDPLSLKMADAVSPGRFVVRAGVISVKIKTKSGDTYDVTGPVVTGAELERVFRGKTAADYPNINWSSAGRDNFTDQENFEYLASEAVLFDPNFGIPLVTNKLKSLGQNGIGTPPGIKGKAKEHAATAGISIGYFLDEDQKWFAETYVLAAPISTSVTGQGRTNRFNTERTGPRGFADSPIMINGQKIIETKLLPPIVMLGRYFGDKNWRFRPFLGGAAMYAIFYDTKATDVLNNYVGGSSPGDTTVSLKNSFGAGPMLGFKYQVNDSWHVNFNVGHVKLKTTATLTTRNTMINSNSPILKDLGVIAEQLYAGESTLAGDSCRAADACTLIRQNGGLVSLVMKGVAADRGSSNLGTYVRKTETELKNTMFMLSIGRSF